MTKAKFYEMMKESRANPSANITINGRKGGKTALVINQYGAPNCFLSMHRDGSAAFDKAFITYNAWLKEYFMTLDYIIEADHAKALEMNIARNPVEEMGL